MAGKGKKTAGSKKSVEPSTVTRIKATDTRDSKPTPAKKPAPAKPATPPAGNPLGRLATPLKAMGRYFRGAWHELRQVRWPNRRATWSLTGAMLVFTGFFAVFILLLDALFKYVFQLILG